MIPREIVLGTDGRQKLASGIKKLAEAVKSTLGAAGQTVLLESQNHTRGHSITKDGVTVAEEIFLDDPVENIAAQILKDAAKRTSTSAGDGTTTSIVIAEAMVLAGMSMITKNHDKTEVLREINQISEEVIKKLQSQSKRLTKGRMKDVASISANNDKSIGKIVADAYTKAGKNGLVLIEKSQDSKTYTENVAGIRILRGYDTNAYVNDQKRDECILENVSILFTNHQLNTYAQVEKIMTPIVTKGGSILIIGNATNNFKSLIAGNVVKNGLKLCTITPPQFGYKQKELMQDMAIAMGGKFFSEDMGDDLALMTSDDLGFAKKIVVSRETTTFTLKEGTEDGIGKRIEELNYQIGIRKAKHDIDFLRERIATLSGGMGVIYVGGNSDVEQKELYDRIDDAICAVRSAKEEGVITGGGIPLMLIGRNLINTESVASTIIGAALKAPFNQILTNAGKDEAFISTAQEIISTSENNGYGFNVKENRYENLQEIGVLDPTKVTINAVRNATSVATTILGTNAIVTFARAEK